MSHVMSLLFIKVGEFAPKYTSICTWDAMPWYTLYLYLYLVKYSKHPYPILHLDPVSGSDVNPKGRSPAWKKQTALQFSFCFFAASCGSHSPYIYLVSTRCLVNPSSRKSEPPVRIFVCIHRGNFASGPYAGLWATYSTEPISMKFSGRL